MVCVKFGDGGGGKRKIGVKGFGIRMGCGEDVYRLLRY